MLKNILGFGLAYIILVLLHEGTHAVMAVFYGEYSDFIFKGYGFEVIFQTPPEQRAGLQWLFISGVSNILTLAVGYLLFFQRDRLVLVKNSLPAVTSFYLVVLALLADPFNLSIGPFIYSGDALGIELGSGIPLIWIQLFFFGVVLINREILAQVWLPAFGVRTRHPLFRPWCKFREIEQP
jgi:hypothetical protein